MVAADGGHRGHPSLPSLCVSAPLREAPRINNPPPNARPKNPPTTLQKMAAQPARFEVVRRSSPIEPAHTATKPSRGIRQAPKPDLRSLFDISTLIPVAPRSTTAPCCAAKNVNRKSSGPFAITDALLKSANKNEVARLADMAHLADKQKTGIYASFRRFAARIAADERTSRRAAIRLRCVPRRTQRVKCLADSPRRGKSTSGWRGPEASSRTSMAPWHGPKKIAAGNLLAGREVSSRRSMWAIRLTSAASPSPSDSASRSPDHAPAGRTSRGPAWRSPNRRA